MKKLVGGKTKSMDLIHPELFSLFKARRRVPRVSRARELNETQTAPDGVIAEDLSIVLFLYLYSTNLSVQQEK